MAQFGHYKLILKDIHSDGCANLNALSPMIFFSVGDNIYCYLHKLNYTPDNLLYFSKMPKVIPGKLSDLQYFQLFRCIQNGNQIKLYNHYSPIHIYIYY